MRINNSKSKNLSVEEHIDLLDRKYERGTRDLLNFFENKYAGYTYGRYSMIYVDKLFLKEFKNCNLVIDPVLIKNLIKSKFLTYGFAEIFRVFKKNEIIYLENEISEELFEIDLEYIIFDNMKIGENLYFDTSLIYVNYLNLKTINHFSVLILNNHTNSYFLKRKDCYRFFSLKVV